MSSWFSQLSSTVSNVTGIGGTVETIKTMADTATDGQLYHELQPSDLEWTLASGSSTENQVFYVTTPTGGFAFVQLIHSNVGLWNPTISFTCRFFEPESNTNFFRTITTDNFVLSADRRSVKTDHMSITSDPTFSKYSVSIKHPDLVVSLEVERVDRGFKVGEGKAYLGSAGFVSHKFWPRCQAKGTFIVEGAVHEMEGLSTFIHAIQGMQPQLIASNWNFCNFQSAEATLTMMQFQTTKQYGAVDVNQGALVLDGKLTCVSVDNHVELSDMEIDPETEYEIPKTIKLTWNGKTIDEDAKDVKITMNVSVSNLLDKIDVLNEIPWVIRKLVQTFVVKPYIYQWLDKGTAEIQIGEKTITTEGQCFQELVFVSGF
ncbi:putative cell survival pathways protein [Umbelopsis sp. WA50703]